MKKEKIQEILKRNQPAYVKGNKILNNNLLVKNLKKFIVIGTGKAKNPVRGKAEVFRRLVVFADILSQEIERLSDELVKDKVEIFFPDADDPQKVIVVKDVETGEKYATVDSMSKKGDWEKSLRQLKNESVAEGSYSEEKFQ